MSFKKILKSLNEDKKMLPQNIISKISKEVRKNMPIKSADKWEDPYEFLNKLVDEISKQGYEVDEYEQETFRNKCTNRKQDVYMDVDKASQSISFKDKNTDKIGYVHVSCYNDPGTKHDYRYECSYYFG